MAKIETFTYFAKEYLCFVKTLRLIPTFLKLKIVLLIYSEGPQFFEKFPFLWKFQILFIEEFTYLVSVFTFEKVRMKRCLLLLQLEISLHPTLIIKF